MSKRKILMVLVCAVVVFASMSSNLRAETRKYLKIGGDPHPAVAGNFFEGETEFSLPRDLQVLTVGGSGREYTGWLHIGEVLIVKGDWVVRIKKCGNPVYFPNHQRVGMECFRTEVASSEQEYEYAEVPDQPQQPQIIYQPQPQQFTYPGGAPVQQSVVVYSQPQQSQPAQPVIEENRGSIWGEVLGTIAYGVASGWANNQSQSQYNDNGRDDRDRNYHRPQRQYQQPQRQYQQPQRQYQQPQRPTRPTRPPRDSGGPVPYRPNGPSGGGSPSSGGPHPYQPNGPAGSRGN